MKTRLLFAVSMVAVFTLGSAAADPLGPAEGAFSALPPFKIVATARASGFEPLGPPVRRGEIYWLRAISPRGRDVALIIEAASGRPRPDIRIANKPTPR